MSVQAATQPHLTPLFAARWEQASEKFIVLAEAIPAEFFEKSPVAGTRTCAAVLRHVAFWNQYVADTLRGGTQNDADNELPASEYPDKESIIAELKRTTREVASTLRGRSGELDAQTAELMMTFVEHTSEHYGQLVVYARLGGIVPPASRS